jgi:hypothetical protein
MSESLSAERHHKLLKKYFIPDMGDHTAIGGVLSSILDGHAKGRNHRRP